MELLIFDWGDTVMVDYNKEGPMYSWDKVECVSGVKQALIGLSQKYPCCIATNADYSGKQELILALKRVGIDKYFRNFFSSKDLGYEKPDKRFFLNIANEMQYQPVDCIMIGNNYKKDIEGAKNVGMKTVFFNNEDKKGVYPAADMVISSMDELVVAIQTITDKAFNV